MVKFLNIKNHNYNYFNHYYYCYMISENILKIKAKKNFLPMQKGDVLKTLASQQKSKKIFDFSKNNHLSTGLKKYISWFRAYYLNEK